MWYLLRKNLWGRATYNSIIVAAVTLALTVALTAVLMTDSVQKELEHKARLLGPELAVVPVGTKERGQVYLTRGPGDHGLVPASALEAVRSFPETEAATAQKLLGRASLGDEEAMLIAFDPATDFAVRPWLAKKYADAALGPDSALPGFRIEPGKDAGEILEVEGRSFVISGRLLKSGTFLDGSVFFPFTGGAPAGDPSWILLRLRRGASVDMSINKLETNIADIEVIARPEMLKTIDDQLHGVIWGGGLNTAALLVVAGSLLVMGTMLALQVYERRREFGLLKAMGASNSFVLRLIICEALVLGALGGMLGLLFSAVWLGLSGMQFLPGELPQATELGALVGKSALLLLLTMGVGVLTALYPALIAARMEPYTAIRSGE